MPQFKSKPKGKPGRPKNPNIYPGARFGFLEVQRWIPTKPHKRVLCICRAPKKEGGYCNKEWRGYPWYLTRTTGPTTNCGCQTYIEANPYPREKGIWYMLFKRCYDPSHISYKYYGALGVKVHWDFHRDNPNGWLNFINHVGGAPSKAHTLDRKDPRKDYEPGNLRWATAEEQAGNKRENWKGKPL